MRFKILFINVCGFGFVGKFVKFVNELIYLNCDIFFL